jgi:phage-related protein
MPTIGSRCHELGIRDERQSWRVVYRVDPDAVIILDVFRKTTRKTPTRVVHECRRRIRMYDELG